MADLTATQIDALIESTRSAYATAIASPKPNYTIGGRTVNYADYLKTLLDSIVMLQKMSAAIPSESVESFDYAVDDQGTDSTEHEGDDDW